jgi:hypothetical protein
MNPRFVSRRPPQETEKKERNTHPMAENRRVSAYQGVEKKVGNRANTRPAGHEKGDREVCLLGCLVVSGFRGETLYSGSRGISEERGGMSPEGFTRAWMSLDLIGSFLRYFG